MSSPHDRRMRRLRPISRPPAHAQDGDISGKLELLTFVVNLLALSKQVEPEQDPPETLK